MVYRWLVTLLIISFVGYISSAARIARTTEKLQENSVATETGAKTPDIKNFQTWPDDVQLGCKELRAKRFISDGFCTSIKPIREVVCAGQCLPIKEQNLPWWSEFTKYWAKPKFKEWRCEEAVTKRKKVQLECENGESRTYRIKIVKSCRCKKYSRGTNTTDDLETRVKGNRKKWKCRRKKGERCKGRKGRKHRGSKSRDRRKNQKQKHVLLSTLAVTNTTTLTTHSPETLVRVEE